MNSKEKQKNLLKDLEDHLFEGYRTMSRLENDIFNEGLYIDVDIEFLYCAMSTLKLYRNILKKALED